MILWEIISKYIDPESVQTFSLLCKGAYEITTTASFWINLYKRAFYNHAGKSECLMFEHLKPDNVVCTRHQLRLRVIRALYAFHFKNRLLSSKLNDPHSIKGSICTNLWRQSSSKWDWKIFILFDTKEKKKIVRKKEVLVETFDELLNDEHDF